MHLSRAETRVEPFNIDGWNSLAKIGLDGINAFVEETLQAADEPLAGFRVGEVNDSHASLPEIPLENISICTLEEVAFAGGEFEDRGCLGEVWIDPDTDFLHEAYKNQQAPSKCG